MSELVELLVRFSRCGQSVVILFREDLAPERDRVDAFDISILQPDDSANANLLIGFNHGFEVLGVERVERHHVLNTGHARPETFQSA